jgi:pyruvate,water dikinase
MSTVHACPFGAAPTSVTPEEHVIDLRDEAAAETALVGGKTSALATATRAGLTVLPGVALTTRFTDSVDAGAPVHGHPAVREAFERVGGSRRSLVARSSSVAEDTAASSMAGQFDSVIGIDGLADFEASVQIVLDSRARTTADKAPIGVLVQPLIEPVLGGVMFGIDPVSGRSDRRVVSAVHGGPEPLVSGEVNGSRYVLDPDGRVLHRDLAGGPKLSRAELRQLVALSDEVAEVFGGPQDVEWAITEDGTVVLLQSRPVTTETRGVPSGPVYGPGPVAETFPEPLTELEHDLWVPPLREAVRQAVLLAGAASPAEVAASEVVVAVRGHVGIDLQLTGDLVAPISIWRRLSPFPAARRLRGAWRVGRLRTALPALAGHILDRTDADLESVPELAALTNRQLTALLRRSQDVLRALHAHEILMGMLTDTGSNRMTGASVALRVLAEARREGLTDDEILEHSPVVLALTAPRIAPVPELPADILTLDLGPEGNGGDSNANDNGILREALRLRVRWVQELSGRAAWELGQRLAGAGELPRAEVIRHMPLDHVEAVATGRASVVPALVRTHEHDFGHPLPAQFQLSDRGLAIRAQSDGAGGGGTGAGGGTGRGPVTFDTVDPPAGSVLVTTTLTPGLGPLLARLNGIVSETGSVLSHLAILAREAGVATVVGFALATEELEEGSIVVVDGESGRVTTPEEEAVA